jgi:uncharacterized membrane protein
MLAVVRPDNWDFPLFLHVLGAVLLFGGAATVTLLVFASWRRDPVKAALLRKLVFTTTLIVVWPSFILMRLSGQWIADKEGFTGDNDPGWIGIGYLVGDAGVLVLVLLTIFSWLAWRRTRPDRDRPVALRIVGVLAPLYVIALAVAWFAMTTKNPS